MLDDNDIKKLIAAQKEAFVTKEEFENFMEISATKEDIKKMTDLLVKMDNKVGEVVKLKHRVEYIENTLNIQPI